MQTIAIPSTGSSRLTVAGSSSSEGFITRSTNGNAIVFGGYDANAGTLAIAGSNAATVNRVVGVIDASGTYTRGGWWFNRHVQRSQHPQRGFRWFQLLDVRQFWRSMVFGCGWRARASRRHQQHARDSHFQWHIVLHDRLGHDWTLCLERIAHGGTGGNESGFRKHRNKPQSTAILPLKPSFYIGHLSLRTTARWPAVAGKSRNGRSMAACLDLRASPLVLRTV